MMRNIWQLNMRLFIGMQLMLAACPAVASDDDVLASIGEYTQESFSPQRNELFEIPVTVPTLQKLTAVQIEIRTADDDPVRPIIRF